MNRSPLHSLNEQLGARFVDFGGWEMPVQYESVLKEHRSVRGHAGLFDVTHLGRFELTGAGASSALGSLLCNDIERIGPGRCQYTMILNDGGGVIDDLIVWWMEDETFWVMPNAANQERVMSQFASQPGCEVADRQISTVFLALQGPEAKSIFSRVVGEPPGRFRNIDVETDFGRLRVAGTGYTGEGGVEICLEPGGAPSLFTALQEAGAVPCGLGSRDTLRLEAGFPLWGQDINESTTPLEAGLGFAVSLDHEFTGRDVLVRQTADGLQRSLSGFVLEGRGVPRHDHEVRSDSGSTGTVTSGNHSPILDTGIGLAYMSPPLAAGIPIEVNIRDRWVSGLSAKPPLHKSKE